MSSHFCITASADSKGFTLIELTMIIILVGILSAIALPKLANLATSARLSKLNDMKAALISTSNEWYLYATMQGCSPNVNAGIGVYTQNGVSAQTAGCYPDAGDNLNYEQIDALITTTGFNVSLPATGTADTYFDVSEAPNPSTCRVDYTQGYGNQPISISVISSGC
jgi:MSHA pilin protein MshA